ncbi:MAG: hypothetical protein ABIS59_00770, partial [Candidatus Saccharibacteria bacterium]
SFAKALGWFAASVGAWVVAFRVYIYSGGIFGAGNGSNNEAASLPSMICAGLIGALILAFAYKILIANIKWSKIISISLLGGAAAIGMYLMMHYIQTSGRQVFMVSFALWQVVVAVSLRTSRSA